MVPSCIAYCPAPYRTIGRTGIRKYGSDENQVSRIEENAQIRKRKRLFSKRSALTPQIWGGPSELSDKRITLGHNKWMWYLSLQAMHRQLPVNLNRQSEEVTVLLILFDSGIQRPSQYTYLTHLGLS